MAQGTVLLLAYAAGLAMPFLAVAMGASWVARRLGWVGRHHRAVSIVSGAMLVVLGVLMVTNTARASRGVHSAVRRLTEAHEWRRTSTTNELAGRLGSGPEPPSA